MIYKNMGEALQANAYSKFKDRWGVEPYEYHLKEWDDIRGWVPTSSIVLCSKQQYNVAVYISAGVFNNDVLVIEREDFTITLTPSGYSTLSIDRVSFDYVPEVINAYMYFEEIFEKCL